MAVFNINLVDSIDMDDTLVREPMPITIGLEDAMTMGEGIGRTRHPQQDLSDDVVMDDSLKRHLQVDLADGMTMGENITSESAIRLKDDMNVSDAIATKATYRRDLSDDINMDDTISRWTLPYVEDGGAEANGGFTITE